MDWDQLELNPKVITAIKKAKLKSIKEVLHLSGPDLQRLTKLSSIDVQHLLKTVSLALRNNCVLTALHIYQQKEEFPTQHKKLSFGCSVLNRLLRGGLPLVGITELAGQSSAGKTQIGLQLSLCVQYPYEYGGLESGVIYICTEDVFPDKRLQQLIALQHELRTDVPGEIIKKIKFGNSIFIEHAADIITYTVDERGLAGTNMDVLERVSPALGITWSNQLLMRLMVSRSSCEFSRDTDASATGTVVRTLSVIFAPHLPQSYCHYMVNAEGVKGAE
ncbi:DNA repair protein XRCC3 isoform X3 [Phascolarctos cinereus]|uniref:DNA repair protein XRCC3 isoform X3 n=1 Tax=Phascolarctos cinereus TaxID=38626 RepID=A0A6P5J0G4_PHACI|nr:DNA repair protein XRCC3 isoform X3 [Phascolarctos cinereus]